MEYLYERIAYLKGLAEGMKIDETSDKGKLMTNIIEVLGEFADAINEINEQQVELDEYVEALDEDLSTVEDEIYGEDDECDCDCGCDCDEDYDYVEVECPKCKEFVYLDESLMGCDEEVVCPSCHEPIELVEECGCCGCNEEE